MVSQIYRRGSTHLLPTKAEKKAATHLSLTFLQPHSLQFGLLFQLKPLKSLLLAGDPQGYRPCPPPSDSPALSGVPSSHSKKNSPRSSEWVGVRGDQSRKGRGRSKEQQESSSEAKCQRRGKIHWTGNIAHTNTHTINTYFVSCTTWSTSSNISLQSPQYRSQLHKSLVTLF